MMKKILIFLLGCAIGYGCWHTFINSGTKKSETEQTAVDSATMTISIKQEIKDVQGDSIAEQDSLSVDTIVVK